tara:strand:- start:205 stop:723 length:519 start_codon:yes stop_codon:yes gene_type:complete
VVEMNFAGLGLDASNSSPFILLRDTAGIRQVPIQIDKQNAANILKSEASSSKENIHAEGSLLTYEIIKISNLKIKSISLYFDEQKSPLASLRLSDEAYKKSQSIGLKDLQIDTTVIEGIVLAVHAKCTIWMQEEFILKKSIPVDHEKGQKDREEFKKFINTLSPSDLDKYRK